MPKLSPADRSVRSQHIDTPIPARTAIKRTYPWPHDQSGLLVAYDTETSGLYVDDGHRISTVSIAWWQDGEPCSIALPFNQGMTDTAQGVLELYEDPNLSEEYWVALMEWLSRQWLVMHNAKFDLLISRAGTDYFEGKDLRSRLIWDTMLAASVISPREEIGLKPVSERLRLTSGQERIWEERVKKWVESDRSRLRKIGAITAQDISTRNPRYDLMPWEIMEGYALQDTRLTLLLHAWQLAWIEKHDHDFYDLHETAAYLDNTVSGIINRRFATMMSLTDMEMAGVGWNYLAAERAGNGCVKAVQNLDKKLVTTGVRRLSSQGLIKWLENEGCWDGGANDGARYTPGGARSLDAQELDRLIGYWANRNSKLFDVLSAWKQRAELDRAGGMWYHGYSEKLGQDGRLRTSYRQLQTVTGRMSVERINLQAMPRGGQEIPNIGHVKVKELIGPAPGYVMYNLDLSQAELRHGAKLAECRKMVEMLEHGRDLHGATATALFGGQVIDRFCVLADVPEGTWMPRTEDDASNDLEKKVWKIGRQVGKTCTFSCLFRGGANALMRALGAQARIYITEAEAGRWVNSWRQEYLEIPKSWYKEEKAAQRRGWVLLGGGEVQERSWLWGGSGRRLVEPYQAYNRRVQGGIALLNQEWVSRAGAVLRENAHAGRLVLNVHDSLVLEIAETAKPGKKFPKIVEHIAKIAEDLGRDMFNTKIIVDTNIW